VVAESREEEESHSMSNLLLHPDSFDADDEEIVELKMKKELLQ
jgi:hypothetical protein